MKNFKNIHIAFIIFFVLGIAPFFILAFYILPNLEDYAESIISNPFWHVKYLYLTYDGRFFTSIMFAFFNPLKIGWYTGYKLLSLVLMCFFIFSVHELVKQVFYHFSNQTKFLFSGFFILVFFCGTPQIPYTFYYMISSYIYFLPLSFFILLIASLFKLFYVKKTKLKIYISCFVAFLIFGVAGSNELYLIPLLFLVILFSFKFFQSKKDYQPLIIIWSALLVSYFIVFTAPGLKTHFTSSDNSGYNFSYYLESVLKTIQFSHHYIKTWIFNSFPIWSLFVLMAFYLLKEKSIIDTINKIKLLYIFAILIISMLFIYLLVFPYVWSTGDQANQFYDQLYILPFVFFITIAVFIFTQVLKRLQDHLSFKELNSKFFFMLIALVLIIFIAFDNNMKTAYKDILSGEAYKYHSKLKINIRKSIEFSQSKARKEKTLELCSLKICPKSICSGVYFRKEDIAFHAQYKIFYDINHLKIKNCE